MLSRRDIRRRFDRAAAEFDSADFVHAVTRDGLCARLEPMLLKPSAVLDLGSATGSMGQALRKRFRRAHIVSLDLSGAMLAKAHRKKSWLARASFVQADAEYIPFADGAFDLVVANQLLPWLPDPQRVFTEVARVLRKGGVFAFAGLGPDSLQEIGRAWARFDEGPHVNRFPDMHDIGDGLVRAGLADPVLDVDRLHISYENPGKLFSDLTQVGARNSLAERARGLTGKNRFRSMAAALANGAVDGGILLDLELVYGHCWGAGPKNDPAAWRIDASQIPLRR